MIAYTYIQHKRHSYDNHLEFIVFTFNVYCTCMLCVDLENSSKSLVKLWCDILI